MAESHSLKFYIYLLGVTAGDDHNGKMRRPGFSSSLIIRTAGLEGVTQSCLVIPKKKASGHGAL